MTVEEDDSLANSARVSRCTDVRASGSVDADLCNVPSSGDPRRADGWSQSATTTQIR